MSLSPADLLKVMEEHVPFNRLLGIKGESAEPGRAVLVLPVRPDFVGDFRRPALHGGVLSTVIDTAGGMAAWSALAPGETVSTVEDRKSTRLNSSHSQISYAVFCLKKKKKTTPIDTT